MSNDRAMAAVERIFRNDVPPEGDLEHGLDDSGRRSTSDRSSIALCRLSMAVRFTSSSGAHYFLVLDPTPTVPRFRGGCPARRRDVPSSWPVAAVRSKGETV